MKKSRNSVKNPLKMLTESELTVEKQKINNDDSVLRAINALQNLNKNKGIKEMQEKACNSFGNMIISNNETITVKKTVGCNEYSTQKQKQK